MQPLQSPRLDGLDYQYSLCTKYMIGCQVVRDHACMLVAWGPIEAIKLHGGLWRRTPPGHLTGKSAWSPLTFPHWHLHNARLLAWLHSLFDASHLIPLPGVSLGAYSSLNLAFDGVDRPIITPTSHGCQALLRNGMQLPCFSSSFQSSLPSTNDAIVQCCLFLPLLLSFKLCTDRESLSVQDRSC